MQPDQGPWRITLDTNPDDCNLACIMCEEHAPDSPRREARANGAPRRRMSMELLRKVVAEAAAIGVREVIPSTMGEPLLFHGFEEIVSLCREHGLRLNLTTNGTFPRKGARAWAELLVPVTSDVKISWNGATAATQEAIMVGARLDRMVAAAREFVAVRDAHSKGGGNHCRVTLQATFLETNVGELPALVALAADLGAERVKGHHLWAHWESLRPLSLRRSSEAIARWNRCVGEARRIAAERHVLLENFEPLTDGATEDLDPEAGCPFLGKEAWVATDGRFNPCCAPDELRRGLGEFGSVASRPLGELWRSEEYGALVGNYRERPLCRGCSMRRRAS